MGGSGWKRKSDGKEKVMEKKNLCINIITSVECHY
jgi:hypothetical protein